jgi:DnaJ-class molecular chaperone
VPVTEIVTPTTVIKIDGRGIPSVNPSEQAGDIYVKFHIIFPEFLSLEAKKSLEAIL